MYDALKSTYEGKKVFVTGHTGFKGSWLIGILNLLGASVRGYALEPLTPDDLYHLIDGDRISESVIGDLRDKELLAASVTSFQPDFVFHLAAQPLVRLSYQIPAETFEVNAIGTANLLDAIRALDKPCTIVLITTDKVYHNNEWEYPYREVDRLGGYDPYSASKACAELVIDSYRNCFFHPQQFSDHQKAVAVGRAGNVIGGGDWSRDRLLPDIARALGKNEKIAVRNPNAVRPWQHVLEPLTGYLILGAKLIRDPVLFAQAYNFGPHATDALPVVEMVKRAVTSWGGGEYEVMNLEGGQPHEAGLLKLDISKAVRELSWNPRLNAEGAVQYTIDWYRSFFEDRTDIAEFTEHQIQSFLMA